MFKDKLQQAMEDLNLNQTKLSQLTGIGKSSISQYLAGKNVPTEERQEIIAINLGLDANYFREEKMNITISEISGTIPRLHPKDAAKLMGVSDKTIYNGLQDGVFPWGYAIRGRGDKYVYFINAKRFSEIEGVSL